MSFIFTVLCAPDVALSLYLALLGDLNWGQAVASIISLPGEFVLGMMR